jgi:hypothetical protein
LFADELAICRIEIFLIGVLLVKVKTVCMWSRGLRIAPLQ